ncbi:hypothetical protein ACFQV2_31195 [Actinokineospora soli]|uniref:Thymidylate kinase n=1 Tax=Actinokineospora soli TaxID=1048753 RepID=A0ABW2TTN0_9PSEU
MDGFTVLLGPDFAGKSTVLGHLARAGWHCVSYDDEFLPADCGLVAELRDGFLGRALRGPHSADFVVTILQTAVVHLRDEIGRAGGKPVAVDSYYYKILAKCLLTGLVNDALLGWWRTFPKPARVVYLDTDLAEAWRRSGDGQRLNRFEHYGDAPTWPGFRRFQTDLRERVFAEIRGLPVHVVPRGDARLALTALTGGDDVRAA